MSMCSCGVLLQGSDSEEGFDRQALVHSGVGVGDMLQVCLVVEDNATNQQVALAILRKLGHQADAVGNGAEALERLRKADYNIVLMDCEMPGMDGYETARRIREPSNRICNPDIPIIAVTAHAMAGDREKCIAAGMNDYIPKPIEPRQLAEVLPKWMGRPPSTNAYVSRKKNLRSVKKSLERKH